MSSHAKQNELVPDLSAVCWNILKVKYSPAQVAAGRTLKELCNNTAYQILVEVLQRPEESARHVWATAFLPSLIQMVPSSCSFQ